MGGRGKKKGLNATPVSQPRVSMTLREESSGKKHGNVNAKTMCKLDHLKNLAVWAATEASEKHGNIVDLPTVDGQNLETSSPATPLPTTFLSLLDSKRRKRNRSGAKKVAEPETSLTAGDEEKSKQGSSKRRKKSWTSLKEIAQSGGNDIGNNFTRNCTLWSDSNEEFKKLRMGAHF